MNSLLNPASSLGTCHKLRNNGSRASLAAFEGEHNEGTSVRFHGGVPKFFRVVFGEELRCKEDVYLKRWYLETPLFSVRLHHWLDSDDSRNLHDHPWNFITVVLKGGYIDSGENNKLERLYVGNIKYRKAEHKHWVDVDKGGCWTLLLTGPRKRRWGFWIKEKFMKANKYFLTFGAHPCE